MIDRYDEELGFTSMSRTAGFAGATITRRVARGDIRATALFLAEEMVTGALFDRPVQELAAAGVRFKLTTEMVEPLT